MVLVHLPLMTLAWLLFYDFPAHASRQPALILALMSAAAAAFAAADYRPLRGAPYFRDWSMSGAVITVPGLFPDLVDDSASVGSESGFAQPPGR